MHAPAPLPLTRRDASTLAAARSVDLARAEDDAAIRELLRRSPMGRSIQLSFEREPDFAASTAIEGPRGATIVVRGADDAVLAVGHRSVLRRYWRGEATWIGYLGSLRRDPRLVGQWRLLRDGFRTLERTRAPDETSVDLTAIVSDNSPARRLLERGLPGLPRYRHFEGLVTVAIGRQRGALPRGVRRATAADRPSIAASLARWGRRHDGAIDWSLEAIANAQAGPAPLGPLLVLEEAAQIAGCCGLWDLRPVRQARVHGYGGALRWLHPLDRAVAPLLGRPGLPRPGEALGIVSLAALSCVGSIDERVEPGLLIDRFERLLAAARRSLPSDARWLTLTLPRSSPLLPTAMAARSGPPMASELYAVGEDESIDQFLSGRAGRPLHVEGALL